MSSTDITINNLISESKENNKVINNIPKELKFSSNVHISRNKSKPIPVTSEDVHKGNKRLVVHAAGLS